MNRILQQQFGLLATALMVASCGLFGDKQPEYYGVAEAEPLEVPQGLDEPAAESALTIELPAVPLPPGELNAVPPRILANQSDQAGNSKLRWSADGIYIFVEDSSESVQRRLGYAIERSGLEMHGRAPDGNYLFAYEHVRPDRHEGWFSWMAFWRADPPDFSGSYQTLPEPDGPNTRVYLRYADGGEVPVDAAEHVLAILKQRLG